MPVKHHSNNRILPANARAVDVAVRAIRDITPIQQRRYHNAFEVQGYEAVVYHRLTAGLACSCQANRTVTASILNEEGKLSTGKIDEMLTHGLEFSINRYGAGRSGPPVSTRPALENEAKPSPRSDQFFDGLTNENSTLFQVKGKAGSSLNDPFLDLAELPDAPSLDLDELSDVFDAESIDFGGSRCTCCYGTGYVGGYSILNGWRKVLAPHSKEVTQVDGTIEVFTKPSHFLATRVVLDVVLPLGTIGLDAFRFWNNVDKVVPDSITVDSLPYSETLLLALCDGRVHRLEVMFESPKPWTHVEIQGNQSTQSSLIEFPRLSQSGDLSVADLTDSVQINASPLIPKLLTRDILVESTFGKTFIISSSNLWNDRDRNVHGWDCQARVIQPSELLSFLPRRRQLKQRATNAIRDNGSGLRRT